MPKFKFKFLPWNPSLMRTEKSINCFSENALFLIEPYKPPHQKEFNFQKNPSRNMAQVLGRLWERIQGKPHMRKICDNVFNQRQNNERLLELNDLHYSVMLVYNLFNKHFGGRHKEPPSADVVESTVRQLQGQKRAGIDREQFYDMILEWTLKDRRQFVQNKFLLAIMAAPAMAELTKRGGERVPSIGNVIQKIPTPVFVPLYIVGLMLVQDLSIHVD